MEPVAAPQPEPTGPAQRGRNVPEQYVYAVIMPYPTLEVVAQHNVRTPDSQIRAFQNVSAVMENNSSC